MYNFTRVRWESCGIPHGLINLIVVYYNKILTKVEERRDTTSSTSFACMCETSVLFYGFVLFVVLWTSDIILYTFWSKNLLYLIRSSIQCNFFLLFYLLSVRLCDYVFNDYWFRYTKSSTTWWYSCSASISSSPCQGVTVTNSGANPSPIRTASNVVGVSTIPEKPCYACAINELWCLDFSNPI